MIIIFSKIGPSHSKPAVSLAPLPFFPPRLVVPPHFTIPSQTASSFSVKPTDSTLGMMNSQIGAKFKTEYSLQKIQDSSNTSSLSSSLQNVSSEKNSNSQ